jgi:hypothetical protein
MYIQKHLVQYLMIKNLTKKCRYFRYIYKYVLAKLLGLSNPLCNERKATISFLKVIAQQAIFLPVRKILQRGTQNVLFCLQLAYENSEVDCV